MFEKEVSTILFTREKFSLEERLYESYSQMRKDMNEFEKFKYGNEDKFVESEEFKQGFIAAIKIMSSLLLDI